MPLKSEKLEKAGNCRFQETPRTEGGDKVQAVSTQGFPAGLPFPVPEILEFVAFRYSDNFSSSFPQDFLRVFLGNSPETATAFSSFLINLSPGQKNLEKKEMKALAISFGIS